MKDIVLKTKDLCKSFANNGLQNHILDEVNLEIYKGDFTVIMGASGAGKSTLLYCLSGMDTITSGSVLFEGEAIEKKKEKEMSVLRAKAFGFVFQQIHLVSNLTMLENILASGYLIKEKTAKQVKEKAMHLLETVNMKEAAMRLPSQVSGGEAQRAAIARALINEPKLIFADEPTGALNRKNGSDVLDLFTKFHNKGQSIIMVTHDIKTALRASRLLYLSDGQIKGDMSLAPYDGQMLKEREMQIQSWLMSMEW